MSRRTGSRAGWTTGLGLAALACAAGSGPSCAGAPKDDAPVDRGDQGDQGEGDSGTTDADTDADSGTTDTTIDPFRPSYASITGYFGYDPATDSTVAYQLPGGGRVHPQLLILLFDSAFILDGDFAAHACSLVVAMSNGAAPLPAEVWTWTNGETEHTHRGFRLPAGGFDVLDRDDPSSGALRCGRMTFDPELFPDGIFEAVAARDWAIGFGTIDAELAADIASDPAFESTAALVDANQLAGGSMLVASEPPYDARYFALGHPLDEALLIDDATWLTADAMLSDGALPSRGAYLVFPPDWVPASLFFGP